MFCVFSDMWNVVDFITNSLYIATIALRITAYYDVSIFRSNTLYSLFPNFF